MRKSPARPKRKYYSITEEGLEELERFKEHWEKLSAGVYSLLEEGDGDDVI